MISKTKATKNFNQKKTAKISGTYEERKPREFKTHKIYWR